MSDYANSVKIAMLIFSILIGIEWIAGIVLKKHVYRVFDTVTSISSGMTNNLKSILKLSVVIISYQWMYDNWHYTELDTTWPVFTIAFVGTDFAFYWSHRFNHRINIMWNRHIIHHSSEEFNLACALRQSISGITEVYFFLYIPLALIGVPPKVMSITLPIHLFAQFWYHTRLINKMGVLEYILVTPSHHRVHHAINKEYIDKNYASIFIIWDKIFGTFQEELDAVIPVYGVKKPVKTWNPIIINFLHSFQLLKDAIRTKNWIDKFKVWFMPTGWRPLDVKIKYPIEIIEDPYSYSKHETPSGLLLQSWSIIQLTLHFFMQFHLIFLLDKVDFIVLLLYGIFIFTSILSATSLMDRNKLFLPFELIKFIFGYLLISIHPEMLQIFNDVTLSSLTCIAFLFISLIFSIYFSILDKK
ncbi:MAG: sterol desaturase family protein [Flavobacteriales bacterium]|nr:sterol desaturase family protein [Flavobacteriales bacterium]